MSFFTPKEIVSELNKYIVGQLDAKKAVAVALRNRYRRLKLTKEQQYDITPKNILMIGPTGVGKTEIARRLSKLDNSPFIKVEATKYTEVGYVGRDVEQIIRDLTEISIKISSTKLKEEVKVKAENAARTKIINILCGEKSSEETKKSFKTKLNKNLLDNKEIEIEVSEKAASSPLMDIPGMPGAQMGMISMNPFAGNKTKIKKTTVKDAFKILTEAEQEMMLDQDSLIQTAIDNVENKGLVFIDEIDKIASSSSGGKSSNISREGVQRDLLPLVEGTVVSTKYGSVNTDHILFIASGAFHISKPSDLIPELQGRFPIRVELQELVKQDLVKILTEPQNSLISQYTLLLQTEDVKLVFTKDAIDEIAKNAVLLNKNLENIGARRLQTILEKVLDHINFSATDEAGTTYKITKTLVNEKISGIVKNEDLASYIL